MPLYCKHSEKRIFCICYHLSCLPISTRILFSLGQVKSEKMDNPYKFWCFTQVEKFPSEQDWIQTIKNQISATCKCTQRLIPNQTIQVPKIILCVKECKQKRHFSIHTPTCPPSHHRLIYTQCKATENSSFWELTMKGIL